MMGFANLPSKLAFATQPGENQFSCTFPDNPLTGQPVIIP